MHVLPNARSVSTPPPSDLSPDRSPISCTSHEYDPYAPLNRRLLRLRKDLPNAVTYTEQLNSLKSNIAPLFEKSHLITHELVLVNGTTIRQLNDELIAAEKDGNRPVKRQGTYLSTTEPFGMLLDDMTLSADDSIALALEFKPKWLVQSPNAPADSLRCRTCALRGMRSYEHDATQSSEAYLTQQAMCPLDLGIARVVKPTDMLLHGQKVSIQVRKRLEEYLKTTPIIARIHELQMKFDPHGCLSSEEEPTEEFLIAMALRDCTLYIRVPDDETIPIEGKLGDLDLKRGSHKMAYWKGIERNLVSKGWYQGHGLSAFVRTGCQLEHRDE